jgi:hypothetical protein
MTALRADAADFRKTREARFDKPLEEVVAGRDKSVEDCRCWWARCALPARVPDAVQRLFSGAPQSRDPSQLEMDPGSAAHRSALRSIRGTPRFASVKITRLH